MERMSDEDFKVVSEYVDALIEDGILPDHAMLELRDALKAERAEVERLRGENTILRGMAATKMPCHYCKAETMGQCPRGFPGCALADDIIVAEDEVFRAVHRRSQAAEALLDEIAGLPKKWRDEGPEGEGWDALLCADELDAILRERSK